MKFITPFILAVLFALPMAGCSQLKPGCIIENKVVSVATGAVVRGLACKNPAAIAGDLENVIAPLGLCKSETGLIAGAFCPLVVNAVTGFVASKVPTSWDCDPAAATSTLAGVLLTACQQIPVSK